MKVNQKLPLQMRNVNATNKFKGELKALLLYKRKRTGCSKNYCDPRQLDATTNTS